MKNLVIGFIASLITTLAAYFLVVNNMLTADLIVYAVLGIAVVQLIVQLVFFLHMGRGDHWKAISFYFTLIFVLIIVVGTIWVMHHLDYNMMHMSPDEMHQYMHENQGL